MATPHPIHPLDDPPIPVRVKLAAAWTSFMFFYAYVDILTFYKPGIVSDILLGKVFTFDISQTFSTMVLAILAVPTFMIVLSTALPARAARLTTLVVAALYVPFTAFNLSGESWHVFHGLGVALELGLLACIARWAWTWPGARASTSVPGRNAVPDQVGMP